MNDDKYAGLTELLRVIDKLAGPDGCPWDREQTPLSLADYIIEESHELVAALRGGNIQDIAGELGDVFFLLLFIIRYYEKKGTLSLSGILTGAAAKMIRRHPHVFAGASFANMDAQLNAWEAIKKKEQAESGAPQGIFASLPASLPPLVKAYRIHSKAARAGFTWPTDEEAEQQAECEWLEWLDASQSGDEAARKHELGDMIFTLVEVGRRKGIKASEAVDLAARRFLARFSRMEELAAKEGRDLAALTLDEKDELWNLAKDDETRTSGDGQDKS